MTILFAILLFSFLIFIHELGHFLAAKAFKVRVNEFAMFMGPALLKWGKGETQYSIRCIPLGGYCAMEGENEDTDDPRSFQKATWWKRLIILVAGSFMNLVAGVLIMAIVFAPSKQFVTPVIESADVKIILQTVGKVLKRSDTVREGTVSDMDFGDWLMMEGKVDQETYDAKQAEAKEMLSAR